MGTFVARLCLNGDVNFDGYPIRRLTELLAVPTLQYKHGSMTPPNSVMLMRQRLIRKSLSPETMLNINRLSAIGAAATRFMARQMRVSLKGKTIELIDRGESYFQPG